MRDAIRVERSTLDRILTFNNSTYFLSTQEKAFTFYSRFFTRITQNVHLFNAFLVISFKCPVGGREMKYNELTAEACASFFHPEFKFIIDPKKEKYFSNVQISMPYKMNFKLHPTLRKGVLV